MKKTLRNLVIGAVMAAGVLTASVPAMAATQFVQTDMNFRSGAGTTAALIGSVPAGAQVEVLGLENDWNLISYNGMTGYIHAGNLGDTYTAKQAAQPVQAAQAQTQTQAPNAAQNYFDNSWIQEAEKMDHETGAWKKVSVASGYLALRTEPTYDSANEIGQLYTGDKVQLVGAISSSYITVYSPKYNTTGWVNAGFLK